MWINEGRQYIYIYKYIWDFIWINGTWINDKEKIILDEQQLSDDDRKIYQINYFICWINFFWIFLFVFHSSLMYIIELKIYYSRRSIGSHQIFSSLDKRISNQALYIFFHKLLPRLSNFLFVCLFIFHLYLTYVQFIVFLPRVFFIFLIAQIICS